MGNKIARTTQASASEYYLHELPSTCNLVLKEPLGGGRFLKSILCIHDQGLLVVKVYFKRGELPNLKKYEERLDEIKKLLSKIEQSHVWPFQYWLETDKAAYLLRQYFFGNLHDRINTQPFLSAIEKKWIAYQLLLALKQSHEETICHGDIKCENVLVTSWNWLFLADYASFKPTFLPVDNPADFSFYFDTGGRRRCYVAPERFFEPGGTTGGTGNVVDEALKPAMDIFSAGCVIAELFLEGQALFDLSQLLAYRRGQYDPSPSLQKILDVGIREMIIHMIQPDPAARHSAEQYLSKSWEPPVFPAYFSKLHSFFSLMLPLDSDTRVDVTQRAFSKLCKQMMGVTGVSPNQDDMEEEGKDVGGCLGHLGRETGTAITKERVPPFQGLGTAFLDDTPVRRLKAAAVVMEEAPSKHDLNAMKADALRVLEPLQVLQKEEYISLGDSGPPIPQGGKCEGMVLIGSLLCASIRNVRLPQARRGAVQMLCKSCLYIDDEARLQHILPYVVSLLSDPAAIVRCAALQAVCNVLSLVQNFPPSDAKIFPEYILPLLSMLPDDPEESVRICYADNIHTIAETALRFLESSHYMTEIGVLDKSVQSAKGSTKRVVGPSLHNQNESKYSSELSQLRETIARVIQELVMGQKQTPAIRRAFLHHVGQLCKFFGRKQCNDVLLPILPAFLNDRDEQLRAVFYEQIVYVCLFVGQTSVEYYLLPYIEQALSDVEETVIVNALECLAAICVHKLLRKRVLLRSVEHCAPLLCHPSQWVRRSALTMVASAGANLALVDAHAFLLPILSPFLRREPVSLSLESALSACLKPPMSRDMFNCFLTAQQKAESKKLDVPVRGKQKPGLPLVPADANPAKASQEQRKAIIETDTAANLRNTKFSSFLSPVLQGDRLMFAELDDGEKIKAMEGYSRNLSSTMQSQVHNWEVDNSGKLQNSIIGTSAGVGAGFYSNYDGSSEGIPLYSVTMSEKQGDNHTSGSFNEDGSRIIAAGHGTQPFHTAALSETPSSQPTTASSQRVEGHFSASPTHDPRGQLGVLVSRFMSGSSNNVGGGRRLYEVIKDVDGRGSYLEPTSSRTSTVSRTRDTSGPEVNVQPSPFEPSGVGVTRSMETNTGQSVAFSADNQWRPRGVLIAHLQEHHRAVNKVAVSHDNCFFVSASDDGNVKLWDCKRLESNISFRSRLTYSLNGAKALSVCMIGTGPQVAAASSSGKIHILSVEQGASAERPSGIKDMCNLESQGGVVSLLSYTPDGPPMLLYTTQRNGVHLWDWRLKNDAWCLKAKPSQGYISSTALASCYNWLVTGTSRGVLTLWDLRFQIPVNSWHHPSSSLVESTSPIFPRSDSGAVSATRAYVYIAAGRDELALWNAEDGSCQQVLRFGCDPSDSEFSEVPAALLRRKASANAESKRSEVSKKPDFKVEELNEPPPRLPGVRALLPFPGGNSLLTGGTDCKVRMWDRIRPERSYCVCGPVSKSSGVLENCKYDSRIVLGVQVVQEIGARRQGSKAATSKRTLAAAATDTVGCHRDSILSLASVQTSSAGAQPNQRLLISSCRDGSIKVWR